MITTTATIADSIRAAFPFGVDKLPLSGPDGLRTPHYGLFRDDTGDCVGVACKRGYVPHTVDDVCALAEAAQSAFDGDSQVRCLFRDGHYVTVAPSTDHRRAIFGTRDNIFPRLIVRAGYDGRAFRAELGFFRDACRNLAIIRPAGRSVSSCIKHTHHLRSRIDDLRMTFQRIAASWDGVANTARRLDSIETDLAEFIRQVYPIADDATRRTRNAFHRRTDKIVRRIMHERYATGRDTRNIGRVSLWEALNGIQGYVQHDQARHGRPDEITRAIIALDDAAVSRATELALSLAV
jgi:hypothetical protein